MRRRAIVVSLGALLVAVPAFPCGGPGADIVDQPLVPVSDYLAQTLYDDEYQVKLRPELRFLEPFHRALPDSIAALYSFAYEGDGNTYLHPDDTLPGHFEREAVAPAVRAIERGEFAEAAASARHAVDAILDLPAGVAAAHREALRASLEIADLAPRLTAADRAASAKYFGAPDESRESLATAGALTPLLRDAYAVRTLDRADAAAYADAHPDSPRLASLRFVALQEAMRAGIPDGYAGSVKDSVKPEEWTRLERLHDTWLREFPAHPLADLVRLSRERLFYFKGDDARAWNELLDMYPRHRQRVLGEMRYLVQQSVVPESIDDPRIDWPLRAALVPEANLTPDRWTFYWKATESHRREPWVVPMQERLLWRAITLTQRSRALPTGFPSRPGAPTELWASLRLLALLAAGDVPAAFAQADSMNDVGAIRVRLHLMRREWGRALAVSPVGDPATAYLVRVLAPQSVLDSLASAPRSPLTRDAGLTIAGRRAAAGDWAGARRAAVSANPGIARAWARTAALAADTSRAGKLALARWMRDREGELFFGENTFWLRGLNWRLYALGSERAVDSEPAPKLDPRLPWSAPDERAMIARHLQSTTELYYALHAYAAWLDGATAATPGLGAVVREADKVYNRLVSWDERNSRFWTETLTTSPEARSIRRAGALARRR
jgi:hypothetical protein